MFGLRPIASDYDDLFVLDLRGDEAFFGWPDCFHDPVTGTVLPVTDPLFCISDAADIPCPTSVLVQSFLMDLDVQPAFAQFTLHASANKLDFSTSPQFGAVGDLFVAETGAFVPTTGAERFTGYKVVRVDRGTGKVRDFIVNPGQTVEQVFNPESFNKPIDVKFDGDVMWIVDFGMFEPGLDISQPGTGKVWIVSRRDAR